MWAHVGKALWCGCLALSGTLLHQFDLSWFILSLWEHRFRNDSGEILHNSEFWFTSWPHTWRSQLAQTLEEAAAYRLLAWLPSQPKLMTMGFSNRKWDFTLKNKRRGNWSIQKCIEVIAWLAWRKIPERFKTRHGFGKSLQIPFANTDLMQHPKWKVIEFSIGQQRM